MTAHRPQCPPPEILEAAWPDAGPGLKDHLQGCSACAAEWAQIGQLARLGHRLPDGAPDAARANAVRDAVLTGALTAELPALRSRRWLWLAAAALVVGGASAATWYTTRAPEPDGLAPVARHRVEPLGEARFVTLSEGPDTRVEVRSGSVRFQVAPRRAGERFRVVTDDGSEVEVRGTRFTVTVDAGRLQAVTVDEGQVAVRGAGAPPTELGPGEIWEAAARPVAQRRRRAARRARPQGPASRAARPKAPPAPADAAPPSQAPPAEAPPSEAPPAPPTPEGPGIAARLMKIGQMTLAAGRPAKAAVYFERALAAPDAAQVVEAARLARGLAWAQAQRADRAIPALRAYLAAHPRAPQAAEARVALAQQLARVGRPQAARVLLAQVIQGAAGPARRAALAALAELPPSP